MGNTLLSISIVTYQLDAVQFEQVLKNLRIAIRALEQQTSSTVQLCIVDNGNDAATIQTLLTSCGLADAASVINTGHNLGYGKAHNRALATTTATYHLILNPDVLVFEDTLLNAMRFMEANTGVAALSPHAIDAAGQTAHLCKRYPALLDLALRGFAPAALKQRFDTRLSRYEQRSLATRHEAAEVELISGCFMFCRTAALGKAGGFNPAYFLYFEDFALSIELKKSGKVLYFPGSRIVHYGGNAARKGLRHFLHFSASALRFYHQYGWKLL